MEEFIDENFLGVCIPTFNRAAYLGVCLNSLANEVSKFNFTIYISDNASVDGTEKVISAYRNKHHKIVYTRNITNLGFYRNFLNVIKMAKTEYVWLMGDDDAIKEGSMDIIISSLKRGFDYIIVNSIPYDARLENIKSSKTISCKYNKEYLRGSSGDLLDDLKKWAYHGYISSMIIRAKIIQDLISKYENEEFVLFNNTWFPLAMFYEAIKDCKGLFLCDPIVKNRDNPRASEKDFWNHMYVDHIKAIEYLGSLGYDSKILKRSLNFSITGALFISTISKCSSQNVTLSDKFVKKDNMIPFHIKSIIFLTDKVPLILLRIFKGIIDRLRQI